MAIIPAYEARQLYYKLHQCLRLALRNEDLGCHTNSIIVELGKSIASQQTYYDASTDGWCDYFLGENLETEAKGNEATVEEHRHWNTDTVRIACIKHKLYTNGSNADYERMLDEVASNRPTTEQIYRTAKDIQAHSDESCTIGSTMYYLANEACWTTFEVYEGYFEREEG